MMLVDTVTGNKSKLKKTQQLENEILLLGDHVMLS